MREIPGIIKAAPPAALRPIPSSSPSPSEMTPKVRPPSAQQPVQTLQNRGDRVASELIRPNILNATSDARRNNYQIGQEERAEQTRIRQEGRLEDIKIRQEGRTEESQVRQEDRAEERGGRQDEARAVLERELAEFNSAIKKDYAEWGHKNLGGEQKMDLLNREADAMNVRLALEASRIRSSLLNAEIEIMSKVELGEKSKQLGTFITGARDTIRASKVQETFNAAFPGDDDHDEKTEWVDEVLVPSGVIPKTPGGWNGLTESQKIVAMDYMYNNPNQNAQAIRPSIDARYSDQLTALDKAETSRLQMQTLSQGEGAMAKGKLKEIADSLSPIIQLGSDTTVRMRKGGKFVPEGKPQGPVPAQPQHTPPKQQGNSPITQKPLPSATTTPPTGDDSGNDASSVLKEVDPRDKSKLPEPQPSKLEGTVVANLANNFVRKPSQALANAIMGLDDEDWNELLDSPSLPAILSGMVTMGLASTFHNDPRLKELREKAKVARNPAVMGLGPDGNLGVQNIKAQSSDLIKFLDDEGLKYKKWEDTKESKKLEESMKNRVLDAEEENAHKQKVEKLSRNHYNKELTRHLETKIQKVAKFVPRLATTLAKKGGKFGADAIRMKGTGWAHGAGVLGWGLVAHDAIRILQNVRNLTPEQQKQVDEVKAVAGKVADMNETEQNRTTVPLAPSPSQPSQVVKPAPSGPPPDPKRDPSGHPIQDADPLGQAPGAAAIRPLAGSSALAPGGQSVDPRLSGSFAKPQIIDGKPTGNMIQPNGDITNPDGKVVGNVNPVTPPLPALDP